MSSKQEITSSFNEIWEKLNAQWKGEDSNAFYQQYVAKTREVIEDFEDACFDLSTRAADFSKHLQIFEQSIDNK